MYNVNKMETCKNILIDTQRRKLNCIVKNIKIVKERRRLNKPQIHQ